MNLRYYSSSIVLKISRFIILFLVISSSNRCTTWNMGRVGYLEPSAKKIDVSTKTKVGETCTVIMGEPFIEKALRNANSDTLTQVVIMIEPDSFKSCYRVYSDKNEPKTEVKK